MQHRSQKIEQGIQDNPTIEFVKSIRKVFNVNANWYVDGTGDMFDHSTNIQNKLQEAKAQIAERDHTIKALMAGYKKLGEHKRVTQAQGDSSKNNQIRLNLPTPAPTRCTAAQ